jgi:hypothetical protein
MSLRFFLFVLSCSSTVVATPTPDCEILERVAITGASVTAGMGLKTPPIKGDLSAHPMNFKHVVEGMLKTEPQDIEMFADIMFFRGTKKNATEYIQNIVAFKPTLVIGIDLLFWFGYGTPPFDVNVSEYRLNKLNHALSLLEQIEAPMVLGDLPDMSEAIGHMLSKQQVPSPQLLEQLNANIYAWANEREHVSIIPVNQLAKSIVQDEEFSILNSTWPAGSKKKLLQTDMLHTTLEGTTAAGLLIIDALDIDCFETNPKTIMKNAAEEAREDYSDSVSSGT